MPRFSPRISSSGSKSSQLEWKCPYCGAMNEDENMVCDGCGDERPVSSTRTEAKTGTPEPRLDFEDMQKPTPSTPKFETDETDASLETNEPKPDDSLEATDDNQDSQSEDLSFPETTPSEPSIADKDFEAKSDFNSPMSFPSPSSPSTTFAPEPAPEGQRYYLVFVNTPASSLIKSRVAVEFDVFPIVSIGRNPENVIVVPDQEVSRKHAQLTFEGGKIILKDLNSANGTYLYDGKQFQRVTGSAEVKPNSILKFGTGTIVRLENG